MVQYLDKKSLGFTQFVKNRDASAKKSVGWLWWLVIFMLAWWLISLWLAPSRGREQKIENEVAAVEDLSKIPSNVLFNNVGSATIQGLRISDIRLKNYKSADKKDDVYLLPNHSGADAEKSFVEVGLIANGTTAPQIDTSWKEIASEESARKLSWINSDGIKFSRTVSMKSDYAIVIRDEIKNNSLRDVSFAPYARIVRPAGKDSAAVATGGLAFAGGKIQRENWSGMEKKSYAWQTESGFVGFEDQYWQTIASIDAGDQILRLKKVGEKFQSDASAVAVSVAAGKSAEFTTKIFAGPKTAEALKAATPLIAGIDQTIDYGWFWFLARPFLWALNALFALVGNYGVAIILLTIVLRIIMWPLTRKSYSSMAAMQKMQPEMLRIQKLYGDDKIRLQAEMLKLYQTHKTSPMGGCLPMLLQIPIFFALYKALLISVPMRHAGFLWISDLAAMDPYFILPVLMGATMWWQQRLQTPAIAPNSDGTAMASTQKIMKWMPAVFTLMFAWMPAGLVLYWMISNLFGIGQIYVIKRK